MIDFSHFTGEPAPGPHRWQFFAPPQFEALPLEHQDQLFFLDAASTEAAYETAHHHDVLCGTDAWGNAPFAGGCYPSVERLARREKPFTDEAGLKKWLYRRGLPFKTKVLLLPVFKAESDPAVVSTWKMVVKYAGVFFSYDNLVITGASTDWCLHYHHDDIFHFGSGRHTQPKPVAEGAEQEVSLASPLKDRIEALRSDAEAILQNAPGPGEPSDFDALLADLRAATDVSAEAGRVLGPLIGKLEAARKA